MTDRTLQGGSDKALGSIMLLAASAVFSIYILITLSGRFSWWASTSN